LNMRILVEPSDYSLDNAGDTAMLRVGLVRLSSLWPTGVINVFSGMPERFPSWAPNVAPIGLQGRRAWLHEPVLRDRLPSAAPAAVQNAVSRLERYLRHSQPRVMRTLLRQKFRHRGEDGSSFELFCDTIEEADLVITTGMGGVTDAFPKYARALLGVLHLAQQQGAVTAMMGQGIGPLDDPRLRSQAGVVLRKLDLITLRERRTGVPLLRHLGVDPGRIVVTGDDAIGLAHSAVPPRLGHALGINLRAAGYSGVDGSTLDRLRPSFQRLRDELGAPAIPIPISSVAGEEDASTARRLLQEDNGVDTDVDPVRVVEIVSRCRVVVVGSYHAAVFALSMGIPAVALYGSSYYRDKFLGLSDMFGKGCWAMPLDAPDLETVLLETTRVAWRRADELRPALLTAAELQIEKSRAAYDRLKQIVEIRQTCGR
jgi:polysaccharide pyruvyl transferase WcaK-like protein